MLGSGWVSSLKNNSDPNIKHNQSCNRPTFPAALFLKLEDLQILTWKYFLTKQILTRIRLFVGSQCQR